MTSERCPACGASSVALTELNHTRVCGDCRRELGGGSMASLRIFVSYGHDANAELVTMIKTSLEARGHTVWFDQAQIKTGHDWRREITEGIARSDRVLVFLSNHSMRDPGGCREEIAIAIAVKGGNIQTVLVEHETEVKPPPSISHIQWLDMHDWRARRAEGEAVWRAWYRVKLAELVRVVESDESRRFAGEIETLSHHLKPISWTSRVAVLMRKAFVGRAWIEQAIETWRTSADRTSRLFWLVGTPGVGKSAFAAKLVHFAGDRVIAAQFCEWDKPDHRRAASLIRSLAFQLATRLPDYRRLLLELPEIGTLDTKNASELFDYLLATPLRTSYNGGRERYLAIIDALDEAGDDAHNELVDVLARNAGRLPDWLGLVVTSRPESAVRSPLQSLQPFLIDAAGDDNRADLRTYLTSELAEDLRHRPDTESLVERILERSEGVFLYIEQFCNDVRHGHLSLDRPDEFPHGLGGTFYQYFQRQFPDADRFRHEIRPALRAVTAAREPLPVDVLCRLLGWQAEELRDFTRPLASLFPTSRTDDQEVIKPYHKSLSDWLADEARAGLYFISVSAGHQMLAEQLLAEYRAGKAQRFALANLLYHLIEAGRHPDAHTLLDDAIWIEQKVAMSGVESVLADLDIIVRKAIERSDWSMGLGAAVARALVIERAFLVPPQEIVPIYARAGAGRHAVEMAEHVEDADSRARLLMQIAEAAEPGDRELARRIRRDLWVSYVGREHAKHGSLPGNVIVRELGHADPDELAAFLLQCDASLQRAIVECLLDHDESVHRIVDLPEPASTAICARLAAIPGQLTDNELIFLAGFDRELRCAVACQTHSVARLLIDVRLRAKEDHPELDRAIAELLSAMASQRRISMQLAVRALLRLAPAETVMRAIPDKDPETQIQLLVELGIGLVRCNEHEQALTAITEAIRIDEQQPCHRFEEGCYNGREESLPVDIIRWIARSDPDRALRLVAEGRLQRLTPTPLAEALLSELPSYEQVESWAHRANVPPSQYQYVLRAAHDLAGAYQAWKQARGRDARTDVLKEMLNHARPAEGKLVLQILRDDLLPALHPAQDPTDMTVLRIEVARAVAAVNRRVAADLLDAIVLDPYRDGPRFDLVVALPALALAGALDRAWRWTGTLDQYGTGFGAMAAAEILRLAGAGEVRFPHTDLRPMLEGLRRSEIDWRDAETILARPWAWTNARVAMTVAARATRRGERWQARTTFAVVAGKAVGYWTEICAEMQRSWPEPPDRELALCEASQWMPVEDSSMLEVIKEPALTAIAWGRVARRAPSPALRDQWARRAIEAAERWPDDEEALAVLWIFTEEMGAWRDACRQLAGRLLDQCEAKDLHPCAPSLLAVVRTGVFDADQRQRVASLACKWRDWLHTFKFAREIPLRLAHQWAGQRLTYLAEAWWDVDPARARECIDLAVGHAAEVEPRDRRDVQVRCIQSLGHHGDPGDWKRPLVDRDWGPALLRAADSLVAVWATRLERGYPEAQQAAIAWAQRVARTVLNEI